MPHSILQRFPVAVGLIALTCALFVDIRAQAAFHAWTISEVFSNADGSVQFIELHTTSPGESVATGAQIRTTSADPDHVFDFPGDLTGPTTNKRLLIATAGFDSLPGGVTPDFTFTNPPTDFFDPAGDTIRLFHPFFGEFHSRTFASVPTDGVNSLHLTSAGVATTGVNSPTNYAGTHGSINRGDYNGDGTVNASDYVVWRDTLTQAASPAGVGADGDTNGTIDAGDYALWRARFGQIVSGASSGQTAAIPEPATAVLLVSWLLHFCIFRANVVEFR